MPTAIAMFLRLLRTSDSLLGLWWAELHCQPRNWGTSGWPCSVPVRFSKPAVCYLQSDSDEEGPASTSSVDYEFDASKQGLPVPDSTAWLSTGLERSSHKYADTVRLLYSSLTATFCLAPEACAAGNFPVHSAALRVCPADLQCALWCREPLTPVYESG